MSRLEKYQLSKVKSRMDAANAKPERPRVNEQLGIEKTLLDMEGNISADKKQIDNEMYSELSEKWKGNGGGNSGDAFITGLTAGLKKGGSSDEKDRAKKVMQFTEKMHDMVAQQNEELFKQENLSNARKYVTPRIMAYLDNYKTMSPNDRKVYLQNSMDEYNQSSGSNYKIIDAAGSEPWKVIVSDGEQILPLDLMDFIKTPEEKKLDYYYKSTENQNYEKSLAKEDSMQERDNELKRQVMQSKIAQNQSKSQMEAEKAEMQSPKRIQEKKKQMVESGEIPEGSLLFDELPKHEAEGHFKNIMDERAKLKGAEDANEALDEMEKIFTKYPNISTSFAKWAESGDDSATSLFLKNMSNQDERAALLDLEKHAGKLNLGTIEQFKGTRPTDVLKKIMAATNPNSKFTAKAFSPIKEGYVKQNNRQISRSKEADNAIFKRYVPTYKNLNDSSEVGNKVKQSSDIDMRALEDEEKALLRERESLINGR